MRFLTLLSLTICSSAFAGGGHGHASDLIPSFVNIAILATFLGWKLKKPMTDFFTKKSNDISEIMERASVKAKEAQMMMEMQSKKVEGLEREIEELKKDSQDRLSKFKSEYAQDVDSRIKTLKEDATLKIEAEKKELMLNLNDMLLDQVLTKTKSVLKNDKAVAKKATNNILEGLR